MCLVAYYVEEGKGIDMDAQSIRSNILPSTHCERCREEDELRLSTLMERADRVCLDLHRFEKSSLLCESINELKKLC